MSTDITPSPKPPEPEASSLPAPVKIVRKKIASVLEHNRQKLPDNITNIDAYIYKSLCRVCSTGVRDGQENGIVKIILSAINPSIFFVNDSVDKLKNMFHEALIMSQIGGNGVRFDRNGLSLDAIAEVFLDIRHEQLHFSPHSHREHDERRASIRDLYPRDVYANNAASMFFMEHPGLIPYAVYITKKLFPFGIGRSCFIGAGGNGVVIKNRDSNLAFKFYYDLQRKKGTALKEWPSQVVFSRAINDIHKEGKYQQFTSPYMEVLSDNHVEMELIDGETLDTLFKRFLLEKHQVVTSATNLRETELDTRMRHAGLSIRDYTITEMLTEMYGQSTADNFSYFLLELEEKWLTHRDIDSSIYSGMRTNVNAKNLMIKNTHNEEPQFVLIDYGNVTIENKGWHRYREDYNLISKNGYI